MSNTNLSGSVLSAALTCTCRSVCTDATHMAYLRLQDDYERLTRESRRLADEVRELSGKLILAQEERDIAVRRAARAAAERDTALESDAELIQDLQRALRIRPATAPLTTDSVQIGPLSIYNPEPEYDGSHVRCYLGSDVVLPHEGGIVENAGRSVLLDRRTWDALVAALGVKEAA